MKRKHLGLITITVAALVVLGVTLSVGLASPDPKEQEPGLPAPTDECVERARESICAFEGTAVPDLQTSESRGVTFVELRSGKTIYRVNTETWVVESVFYGENVEGREGAAISQEEAEATATAYASKHCEAFALLTLVRNDMLDHGDAPAEYSFEWRELIDGALTSNRVAVSINAETGKLMYYVSHYEPIEIPAGKPSFSKEEAIAVAENDVTKRAEGWKDFTFRGVSIEEGPLLQLINDGGQRRLVWRIEAKAEGDCPFSVGGCYFIDAHTGTIVQSYQYL